eukprot:501538-Pelagomonas_calceolata.AAC.1
MKAEHTLPTSIKEKEAHWLKRAGSPFHHKGKEQKGLVGIWKVTGKVCRQLQKMATRSILLSVARLVAIFSYKGGRPKSTRTKSGLHGLQNTAPNKGSKRHTLQRKTQRRGTLTGTAGLRTLDFSQLHPKVQHSPMDVS